MYQKFKNWYKHNGLCTKKAIFGTRLSLCIFCTSSNGRRNMAQIKKDTSLRKAILQAAVTGRLVSAMEGETETGRQLLDRIIEERNAKLLAEWEESLKTNPKAKKPAPVAASKIDESEIPFEIPENWCWCRLGDLFTTSSGTTPASKNPNYYLNGTINWVRTTDLNNAVLASAEIQITEKAAEDYNLKIIPQNSVCMALYGGAGTIGKNALIKFDTTINQSVCAIYPNGFCSMEYIQWFMQWQRPNWMKMASGSRKDPNINQIIVKQCLFPLPPLAVQNAIAAKLEQVLPLVESYENAVLQKEELKGALKDNVKKAVLQEAVQGKLVPQIAGEGNAKDLLEEIIAERNAKLLSEWKEALKTNPKAKKPAPVAASKIGEDEIPFEIPESWCWCRLGDFIELTSGQDLPPSSYNDKNIGIPYLTGASNFSNEAIIINRWTENPKAIALKNDLLLTCKGTVGEMAFLTEEKVHIARQIMSLRTDENISLKYIKCFLYSQIENLKSKAKSMIPGIAREDIIMLVIPLPPLAEQKRIVAAVEELLPLCERLGG